MSDDPAFAPLPPAPPYWAVIFSARRTEGDRGYAATAAEMEHLAARQPGYLGLESARDGDGFGTSVSYRESEAALKAWKGVAEHLLAQKLGRSRWYRHYSLRVARVKRHYAGPQGRQAVRRTV